jgi:hypothetical protein
MADRKKAKTVNEVRARITGARRPTTSKETPPPKRKTTGTPKTQAPRPSTSSETPPRKRKTTGTPKTSTPKAGPAVIPPKTKRPKPTPSLEISTGNPPRGREMVNPHKKTNPPKKLTATTKRKKPLRNSRSPFVFEYK